MKSPGRFFTMIQMGVVVSSLLIPQPGFAYEHPLSESSVRDAYFLGQDLDRARDFLANYIQQLTMPDKGPYVSQIELYPPYAQVVKTSVEHQVGYSAQQAAADYKRRGDSIQVVVQVQFTPTYTGYGEDFWRDVGVGLIQGGKHRAAIGVSGVPLYATDQDGDNSWVTGANIYVQFSIAGVESDSVIVEVAPPGAALVHATFELNAMK